MQSQIFIKIFHHNNDCRQTYSVFLQILNVHTIYFIKKITKSNLVIRTMVRTNKKTYFQIS